MRNDVEHKIVAVLRGLNEADADLLALVEAQQRLVSTTAELIAQFVKSMQELQQSYNLQYLALQQKMEEESRQYTAVSNIMKTKHDTVKNSINNIR